MQMSIIAKIANIESTTVKKNYSNLDLDVERTTLLEKLIPKRWHCYLLALYLKSHNF